MEEEDNVVACWEKLLPKLQNYCNVSVVKSNSTLSMTHGDREQSALCQQINSNEIKRS